MEGKRFDQFARAVATSGSRRRVLAGFLAAALGSLRVRTTSADDDGTAIADASGGDHNVATVVDPATGRQDHDHDRDRDHDRDHDHDDDHDRENDDDNGNDENDASGAPDEGGAPDAPCLCSSETCCASDQTCCDLFDGGGESPVGSICCESDTSCACGDCVPFCTRDVPFQTCECNCRPGLKHCTLSTNQDRPNTCCDEEEECCVVGDANEPDAINVCCAPGTCIPGEGCTP
jgi:hypothetical protein